jgi:hypothetical protein
MKPSIVQGMKLQRFNKILISNMVVSKKTILTTTTTTTTIITTIVITIIITIIIPN